MQRLVSIIALLLSQLLWLTSMAVEVEATVPWKPLAVGETAELVLELRGEGRITGAPIFSNTPEALEIEQPENLQQLQSSRQRIYFITARQVGQWSFGAITVPTTHGNARVTPSPISVHEEAIGDPVAIGEHQGFLSLSCPNQTLYTGQQAIAYATLMLPINTQIRNLTTPLITERQGLISLPNTETHSGERRIFNNQLYTSTIFPIHFTALDQNNATLGPAKLEVRLLQTIRGGSTFAPFTKQESHLVNFASKTLPIEIQALPAEAPAGFQGAVGEYHFSCEQVSPPTPIQGEPVALEFLVSGRGDLALTKAPVALKNTQWDIEEITATTSPHSTPINRRNQRKFVLLLRPKPNTHPTELPVFSFVWFDPLRQEYQTEWYIPPKLQAAEAPPQTTSTTTDNKTAIASTDSTSTTLHYSALPLDQHSNKNPIAKKISLQVIHITGLCFLLALIFFSVASKQKKPPTKQKQFLQKIRRAPTHKTALDLLQEYIHTHKSADSLPKEILSWRNKLEQKIWQQGRANDLPLPKKERKLLAAEIHTALQNQSHQKQLLTQPLHQVVPILLFLCLGLFVVPTFSKAESSPTNTSSTSNHPSDLGWQAFLAGKPQQAYQNWLEHGRKSGFSANLCTQLGNACYESNSHAEALLWYQRALLLHPKHPQANYNLNLAQTKLPITTQSSLEFSQLNFLFSSHQPLIVGLHITWWLAVFSAAIPFFFTTTKRLLYWTTAALLLSLTIAGLSLENFIAQQGSATERFLLLEESALFQNPTHTTSSNQLLQAGTSGRILTQRGNWNYVEIDSKDRSFYRGWLPQQTIQALWPPPNK